MNDIARPWSEHTYVTARRLQGEVRVEENLTPNLKWFPPNSKEFVAALAAGDVTGAHEKAKGWIYSGYKMTIFSTAEEQQREPLEIEGKVLFYPDFALSTAGGDVSVLAPWTSYVIQDRELISGQNPFSDQALLNLLLPALDEKKKSVSAA